MSLNTDGEQTHQHHHNQNQNNHAKASAFTSDGSLHKSTRSKHASSPRLGSSSNSNALHMQATSASVQQVDVNGDNSVGASGALVGMVVGVVLMGVAFAVLLVTRRAKSKRKKDGIFGDGTALEPSPMMPDLEQL